MASSFTTQNKWPAWATTVPAWTPPVLITGLCLIAAVLFDSRAFIGAYAISLFFLLLKPRLPGLHKKWLYIAAALIVLFIGGLAAYHKTDSSLGRLFVYKISFGILKDHFITGVGWGHFSRVYNQYQSAYFRTGSYSEKELLLADYIRYAYNDYLQLIIETGITGLAALAGMALCIVIIIRKSLKKQRAAGTPVWVPIARAQLLAMLIAACFRPVFYTAFFAGVFLVSFTLLCCWLLFPQRPLTKALLPALLGCAAITWQQYGFYLRHYSSYQTYHEASSLSQAGFAKEAVQAYKRLYPTLDDDNYFCGEYANALVRAGDCHEAISVLERLLAIVPNSKTYLQLANCRLADGDTEKAEQAYWSAIYACPNRFIPRYYLFDLYCREKQTARATATGKAILSIPVKIPSAQVDYIRAEVSHRLTLTNERY